MDRRVLIIHGDFITLRTFWIAIIYFNVVIFIKLVVMVLFMKKYM